MPPSRPRSTGLSPQDLEAIPLAPVVLLRGNEGYFLDHVSSHLHALARERAGALAREGAGEGIRDPDEYLEVIDVDASVYQARMFDTWVSPSLFGEPRHIVVDNVDEATDEFIADAVAYVAALGRDVEEVTMVLRHRRGQRGKKLLDLVRSSGFPVVACEPLKDRDKPTFVAQYFKGAGRAVGRDAAQALVEALGSDLRELAAACMQLVDDTQGRVTAETVHQYYGGRVEATGFAVADAALSGDGPAAVTLARHALTTGVDPVPLVAALAMKLRAIATVTAMRSRGLGPGDLKMAPWQVQRAQREATGWTPEGLADAITAVADADAAVKGEAKHRDYAVERAVLAVASARGSHASR